MAGMSYVVEWGSDQKPEFLAFNRSPAVIELCDSAKTPLSPPNYLSYISLLSSKMPKPVHIVGIVLIQQKGTETETK